jgi:hypothetical protein
VVMAVAYRNRRWPRIEMVRKHVASATIAQSRARRSHGPTCVLTDD